MKYSGSLSLLFVSLLLTASALAQDAAAVEVADAAAASEATADTDGAERTELAIGDVAPDFKLKTIGDQQVVLSERFGEEGQPVILLFSRANW